jgi:hypothetical protein
MTVVPLPAVVSPFFGWCVACHDAGGFVVAIDVGLRACQAQRLLGALS